MEDLWLDGYQFKTPENNISFSQPKAYVRCPVTP
jgi:hypothetical protein